MFERKTSVIIEAVVPIPTEESKNTKEDEKKDKTAVSAEEIVDLKKNLRDRTNLISLWLYYNK